MNDDKEEGKGREGMVSVDSWLVYWREALTPLALLPSTIQPSSRPLSLLYSRVSMLNLMGARPIPGRGMSRQLKSLIEYSNHRITQHHLQFQERTQSENSR